MPTKTAYMLVFPNAYVVQTSIFNKKYIEIKVLIPLTLLKLLNSSSYYNINNHRRNCKIDN